MAQTIDLHSKTRIQLDDDGIRGGDYVVTYSLVNEFGKYLKNKAGTEIKDLKARYENTDNIWYADLQLDPTVKGKYLRFSFNITKGGLAVASDKADIDLILTKRDAVRIVPAFYFKDYIVNGELDEDIKAKLIAYPDDAVNELMLAAESDLEDAIEISITPKSCTESHDWYRDDISDTHFMQQMFNFPIISVQSFKMYYAHSLMMDFPPSDLILNKESGVIEYIQTPDKPIFFVGGVGVESTYFGIYSRGFPSNRLPGVFRIEYTHGFDFENMSDKEQAALRNAITRRGMIMRLARISPEILKASESASIDGASYSESSRGIEWLGMELAADKEWIFNIKRKYLKNVHGAVC